MKIIRQLAIIFAICALGELISQMLPFPMPGSIVGMVLLFLLLTFRIIKLKQVEDVGGFLLKNMAFFFIPAGVSLITVFNQISGKILQIVLICLLTTVLTFGITALTVRTVINVQNKLRRYRNERDNEFPLS